LQQQIVEFTVLLGMKYGLWGICKKGDPKRSP